ncbi:MAG: hypothetical protein M1391_08125, partial [Bacteroidetes bacterium]|nr:hypothetical protein [Bacteroidota bacterium]
KDPLRAVVAEKLGLTKKDDKHPVVVKTDDDPARPFYIDAENKYFDKKYNEAIEGFRSIYKNYPKSPYAPKSIYYIGLIYEDNLQQYDSAATTYGLLITGYKTSPLTAKIIEKYTYYMTEKVREKTIQEEKQKAELTKQQLDKAKTEAENQKQNAVKTEITPTKPAVADTLNDSVRKINLRRQLPEEKKPQTESDSTKKTKKIPD